MLVRPGLAALLVVVAAAALRLGLVEALPGIRPHGDELYYLGTAMQIALGNGHVSADGRQRAGRAPGQAFWLSLFVDAGSIRAGDPRPRLRRLAQLDPKRPEAELVDFLRPLWRAQALLATALVALAFLLGRALFGPKAGLAAAVGTALDPVLVSYSHYLWSETLFAVLLSAALWAALRTWHTRQAGLALVTGLLFGAAALTREVAVPLAAACGLWWIVAAPPERRRRMLALVVVLGLGGAAVTGPWSLRNARVLPSWMPIASQGWATLREGNTLGPGLGLDFAELRSFRSRYDRLDEASQVEVARREAFALIREEQPGWLFRKLALTSVMLFEPGSKLYEKLSLGAYGPVPLSGVRALLLAGTLAWAVCLGFAVLGSAGAGSRERRLLPIFVVGGVFLLLVPSFVMPRYRVPLLPLLWVYAGYALVAGRGISGRIPGRGAWIAVAAVLLLLAVCLAHFAPDAASLWVRGRIASGWWFS